MQKSRTYFIIFFGIILAMVYYTIGISQEVPEVKTHFVEIIIKVKPETINFPKGVRKAPASEIVVKDKRLESINKKFNLITIERLFPAKKTNESKRDTLSESKGIDRQDFENIFLLKFPEHINPEIIINEYKKIESVIYAEENIPVTVF